MITKASAGKLSPDLRLSLLLSAVCVTLGLLVLAEWFGVDRAHRVPQALKETNVSDAEKPTTNPFEFPEIGDFGDLVERPLFVEGRRPPPEVVEEPPPPVARTPLDLKLMGLIFSPSGKTALLVDPKGKYKRVKQGALVGGWTLKELRPDSVVLQQDNEMKELALLKPKPKVAAAGSTPPTPADAKAPPKKPPRQAQPADEESLDEEESDAGESEEDADSESGGSEGAEDSSEE